MISVSVNDGNPSVNVRSAVKFTSAAGTIRTPSWNCQSFRAGDPKGIPASCGGHDLVRGDGGTAEDRPPGEQCGDPRVYLVCGELFDPAGAKEEDCKDPVLERTRGAAERIEKLSELFQRIYVWDYPYVITSSTVIIPCWAFCGKTTVFFAETRRKRDLCQRGDGHRRFCGTESIPSFQVNVRSVHDAGGIRRALRRFSVRFLRGRRKYIGEYLRYTEELAKESRPYLR